MKRIGKKRRQRKVYSTPPQVCNIEMMVELSPLAILAIIGVCFDMLKFARRVSRRIQKSMIVYVAGLICFERKQTATKISKRLGGVSHDNLTRLLRRYRWRCSVIIRWFICIIQRLDIKGYLILDDTAIPHTRSKKIEGVYWDFDHAEGRNLLCQRLILLLWSNGHLRIPVGFALWHKKGARKKYRTKNEIARTLVKWVIHKGLKPEYITFDNWYASMDNMTLFALKLKLLFVTKLKRNCKLIFEGKKLQAQTIGSRLLKEKRHYISSKTGVWSRKALVSLGKGLGTMCFVVVRDELDGEKPAIKYLLASSPNLSATTVVQRYRSRWIIETFFLDLKQSLGLAHYQGRKLEGAYHHFALCFVATVILDFLRIGKDKSLQETKSVLSSVFLVCDESGCQRLAIHQPASPSELNHLKGVMKMVKNQLYAVSPLSFDTLQLN